MYPKMAISKKFPQHNNTVSVNITTIYHICGYNCDRLFCCTIVRACPECRITSDFVCPSMFWVDSKEEKAILLDKYKEALGQQNCKYFKKVKIPCI